MIYHCGFCGLEVLQLCFCHREDFKLNVNLAIGTEQALQIRSRRYDSVLRTIGPLDAWLTREPGYNIYRIIYDGWLDNNAEILRKMRA